MTTLALARPTAPPRVAAAPEAARRAHARVRVGASQLAIDVGDIERAIDMPASGLARVPRRAGAIAGLVQIEGAMIPVVALDRWVELGERPEVTDDEPRLLVLQSASGRLAVTVDALLGVQTVRADQVQRIYRDERPEELFDSAIASSAGSGAEPVYLLDAGRLIRLTNVWHDRSNDEAAAAAATADVVPTTRYAVVSLGADSDGRDLCYAIPAVVIERVAPTPVAESTLKIGRRSCGVTTWRGRKLPMIDLAALLGVTAEPGTEWMVVASHASFGMGLCVKSARQLLDLSDAAIRPAPDEPLLVGRALVDGIGTLRVIDFDRLVAAAPEVVISGTLVEAGDGDGDAATRVQRAAPHIVFSAGRHYATPVDGIVGIVALPAKATETLRLGGSALVNWRERTVRVSNMPSIGAESITPCSCAFIVKTGPADTDVIGVAVQKLESWLTPLQSQISSMRIGAAGDLKVITRSEGGQRESLVVVRLEEMAYLLS